MFCFPSKTLAAISGMICNFFPRILNISCFINMCSTTTLIISAFPPQTLHSFSIGHLKAKSSFTGWIISLAEVEGACSCQRYSGRASVHPVPYVPSENNSVVRFFMSLSQVVGSFAAPEHKVYDIFSYLCH